jgi:hypothetical protein
MGRPEDFETEEEPLLPMLRMTMHNNSHTIINKAVLAHIKDCTAMRKIKY